MKRIAALILVAVFCFSLTACGKLGGDDSYGVISDVMYRRNCKDGMGYDQSVQTNNLDWIHRFDDIELGNLELYGCERNGDICSIVDAAKFGIKYRVTQELGALVGRDGTKNGADTLWVNRDVDKGAFETNIKTEIGVGAYYIKVRYTDGSFSEISKTNFFENAKKGMALDMLTATELESGKTVSAIEVILLYETHAGGNGIAGIDWHEYTNWRCSFTYSFAEDSGDGAADCISDNMIRYNCKDGTGYDKNIKEGNVNWYSRLDKVELGNLELYGCERMEEEYLVTDSSEFAIRYRVKQNLGSLVGRDGLKNGADAMWVNSDESEANIADLEIAEPIGVGAYHIKLSYTDGTSEILTKTNFFKDGVRGGTLDMVTAADIDEGKYVASVKIVLLYEVYAGGPGAFGIWWHEYTNWRCEYTYDFR